MRVFCVLLVGLATACAQTIAGVTQGPSDGGAIDVVQRDSATPDRLPPRDDAGPGPCVPSSAIDGAARAVRVGEELHFTLRAAEGTVRALEGDDEGCGLRTGATRALSLRWVTSTAGRVRVAVDALAGARVDRAVLTVGCGAALRRLACAGPAESPEGVADAPGLVWSPTTVAAGTTLTLHLATTGDVVVRTAVVAVERNAGEGCDPRQQRDLCAAGASCVDGVCLPDGERRGACRRGETPCAMGLQCFYGSAVGAAGVCLRPVSIGAACARGDGCVGGSCAAEGTTTHVCAPFGAEAAPCRAREPRCDAGLTCGRTLLTDEPRCWRAIAIGDVCQERELRARCVAGSSCVGAAGASRCTLDGIDGGRCRTDGAPCDAGLVCGMRAGQRVCVAGVATTLPLGASCGGAPGSNCAQGLSCVRGADGVSRCVAAGVAGATCRTTPPYCDGALRCDDVAGVCLRAQSAGEACFEDPLARCFGHCEMGGRCVPEGRAGAPCRAWGEACDAGLACVAEGSRATCVAAVPIGAACGRVVGPTCAPGGACVLDARGVARCLDDGTRAPPCAADGACATGRVCDAGLCRPAVSTGAFCLGALVCEAGSTCIGPVATVFGGSCARDGSPWGACRLNGTPCDAGSVCRARLVNPDRVGLCVPVSEFGGPCSETTPLRECATGLRCDAGRCRV